MKPFSSKLSSCFIFAFSILMLAFVPSQSGYSQFVPKKDLHGLRFDGNSLLSASWKTAGTFTCTTGIGCQNPDQGPHGLSDIYASTSDRGPYAGLVSNENFTPTTTGTISSICWWGVYYSFTDSAACGPGTGDDFEVTYYLDGGGTPGTILAGPYSIVPTTKVLTGDSVYTIPEYGFQATHPPVPVTAGTCYWISISNRSDTSCTWLWNTAPGGDSVSVQNLTVMDYDLAFCLDIDISPAGCAPPPPPVNDSCVNAIPLECLYTHGTTVSATIDSVAILSNCGELITGPGVWFTTIGTGDSLVLSMCSTMTGFDTKLHVFTGNCSSLTCVTANDDECLTVSKVKFMSTLGTQYYVLLSSFGIVSGNFELLDSSKIDSIAPIFTGCPTDTVITADSSDCGENYFWTSPGVIEDCQYIRTSTHTSGDFFPLGITTVTLIVRDSSDNADTCTFNVEVLPAPLLVDFDSSVFAGGFNVQCNGSTNGTLTAEGTGGCSPYTYKWSTGDSIASLTGLGAGSYTVTVYDFKGDSTIETYTMTEPSYLFSTTIMNETCPGQNNGSINLSVTGGAAPYSYSWSNSDTTEDISGLSPGNYSLTVTDQNGCVDSLGSIVVASDSLPPVAAFGCDTSGIPTIIFSDSSIGATTWAWSFGDGTFASIPNPTHKYLLPGTFTVKLVVTSPCGSDSVTKNLNLSFIGISDILEKSVRIFPNPVSDILRIEWVDFPSSELKVNIHSLEGKLIYSNDLGYIPTHSSLGIDVKNIPVGIYILTLESETISFHKKIMINPAD